MTDTERQEAVIAALPGRVEYLENLVHLLTSEITGASSMLGRLISEHGAELFASEIENVSPLASNSNVNTLSEDIKLTEDIGILQFINPNGGARTIRLPRVGVSNKYYIVVNTATP